MRAATKGRRGVRDLLLPGFLILATACGGQDGVDGTDGADAPGGGDAASGAAARGAAETVSPGVPGLPTGGPIRYADLPEAEPPSEYAMNPTNAILTVEGATGPFLVRTIDGFDGPESVLYDADQDVWFVSSFTGPAGERDGNGTVALVSGESMQVQGFAWAVGTEAHPFHAGRGMALQGDTLWVADIDGVHGFHRESGEQLVFVDLSALEPGFLNDIAAQENGAVWVTDTGGERVIQVRPETGRVSELSDLTGSPNGILVDPVNGDFVIAPWSRSDTIWAWNPISESRRLVAVSPGATRVDGLVHWWGGMILAGAQADSSIHVLDPGSGQGRSWIPLPGRPADIGIDRNRNRLAVPYVALNQVQVWFLATGN